MVYFVERFDNGLIKIGSSEDPYRRFSGLVSLAQCEMKMLAVMDGGIGQELGLHRAFAAHRVIGEWFQPVPELISYIEENATPVEEVRNLNGSLAGKPAGGRASTMTADQFRDAAGIERARAIAMGCGYSRAYWSSACTHSRDIPPERLTCMLDALERLNKTEAAFIRAARKEINEVKR